MCTANVILNLLGSQAFKKVKKKQMRLILIFHLTLYYLRNIIILKYIQYN